MNKKTLFFSVAITIVLILGVLLVWVNQSDSSSAPQEAVASGPAKQLPDFQLLDSNQSLEVNRSDILGKKMLLNVWATWCVACRQEHSFLNHLAEQGVRIVGLNYRDRPQLVDTWFAELGNPYDVNLLDVAGRLGEQLPVVGAPETYFIDANGVIQHKHSGIISQSHWDQGLSKIYDQMQ